MEPENNSKPQQHTSKSERDSDTDKRGAEDSDERESRSGIQGAGTG